MASASRRNWRGNRAGEPLLTASSGRIAITGPADGRQAAKAQHGPALQYGLCAFHNGINISFRAARSYGPRPVRFSPGRPGCSGDASSARSRRAPVPSRPVPFRFVPSRRRT